MLLKGGKPVLPDALQVPQSLNLPMLNTVDDLYTEVILSTPGKMAAKLSALLPDLLPMATVPYMKGVSTGTSVLFGTPLAGDQVHSVLALTCQVVAHLVLEASVGADKVRRFS